MDTGITIAITAGAVTSIGWVANHIFSSHRERRNQQIAARLRHIEVQLSELYGPLTLLLIEGRRVFDELIEILGRDHVFPPDGQLNEQDLATWMFWVENYFMPRNEKVRDLLMAKTHLIIGERIPESYLAFLDHHNSWAINHMRWKKEHVEYSWRSKVNWPFEFEEDVVASFGRLKALHDELLGRLAPAFGPKYPHRVVQEIPLKKERLTSKCT